LQKKWFNIKVKHRSQIELDDKQNALTQSFAKKEIGTHAERFSYFARSQMLIEPAPIVGFSCDTQIFLMRLALSPAR
jgi:hypothetical protein